MQTPESLYAFYKTNVHGEDGKHEQAMQALRDAAEAGFHRAQFELSEWLKDDEKLVWLGRVGVLRSCGASGFGFLGRLAVLA